MLSQYVLPTIIIHKERQHKRSLFPGLKYDVFLVHGVSHKDHPKKMGRFNFLEIIIWGISTVHDSSKVLDLSPYLL